MSLDSILNDLKAAFKEQNPAKCVEFTQKALDANADPLELVNKVIGFANELTAKSWWAGGIDADGRVPEGEALLLSDLIVIGECLKGSTDVIKPKMMAGSKKAETGGKIVIGTIEGDVHDIGKSIVNTLWAAAGYTVIDIGIDVPVKKFVLEAKLSKADIVGVSCSMAMCRPTIPKLVAEFKKAGLREKVKIMDGGQSATLNDVENYGIDAHGLDANDALIKAGELVRILKEERLKKGIA